MIRMLKAIQILTGIITLILVSGISCLAQCGGQAEGMLSSLTKPHDYIQKRVSSYDRTGGNDDFRPVAAGETFTLFDEAGPAVITHVWMTIASEESYHLKKLVLRAYWDGEENPSIETPVGDFFGLGLGDYFLYQSVPLSVAPEKALNSLFPMPFAKHARITMTNEGHEKVDALYFNIDYQKCDRPLAPDTMYFHAQYRQAAPNKGCCGPGGAGEKDKNLKGEGNYTWLEATGKGHFVGVTMSVLQNQDGWWGEGDDMFFINDDQTPSINGTGTEDYFLGAWDFGDHSFAYGLFGAPVKGDERAGSRTSVYRFHLDSPIPFTKSIRASIEHGNVNDRSDNYYSVAYWYQTEPHASFPQLPPVEQRLPRLYPVH